jgi:hypothetical protein
VKEIARGAFQLNAKRTPLSSVEHAWSDTATTERIVFTP